MTEDEESYGFDEPAERVKYRAGARRHVASKKTGHQAVVWRLEGLGHEREEWSGDASHRSETEATHVARKYVDALVDQARRVHVLKRRRQLALPGQLDANVQKLDALTEERKRVAAEIKKLEKANRVLIEDAHRPMVTIEFSEALGSFKLTVVTGGKKNKGDSRQQDLPLGVEPAEKKGKKKPPPRLHAVSDDAPDEIAEALEDLGVISVEVDPPLDSKPEVEDAAEIPDDVLDADVVRRALRNTRSVSQAARELSVTPYKVTKACRHHGIDPKAERAADLKPGLDPTKVVWPERQPGDAGDGVVEEHDER